ncbi:MAG: hypothetical protein QNJ68_12660 [Microcoleaceae cyanobacterium MO_207.B10]|nr:hypothetical protein [Microcoleaceae cyanobacterium MO_207.B10]
MFATNIIYLGFWLWGFGSGVLGVVKSSKKQRKMLVIKGINWKKFIN